MNFNLKAKSQTQRKVGAPEDSGSILLFLIDLYFRLMDINRIGDERRDSNDGLNVINLYFAPQILNTPPEEDLATGRQSLAKTVKN